MRGLIVGLPLSCLLWLLIYAGVRNLWAAPDRATVIVNVSR
jgi:hypothetical protein